MRLKLTLRRPGGTESDIVVTTDTTATVDDVARAIAESDPASGPPASGHPAPAEAAAGQVVPVPVQAVPSQAAVGRPGPVLSPRLTLSVSPPAFSHFEHLEPTGPIGEAPVGSGYVATIALHDEAAAASAAAAPVAAVLRVLSGPDAGREFPLRAGDSVIGRDAGCEVALADPLVSKWHARIRITETGPGSSAGTVELADLNSANGLLVDGGIVTRLTLQPSQTVTVGDTEFAVALVGGRGASAARPDGVVGGSLRFTRAPRVERRYPGTEHPSPTLPVEKDRARFPWLSLAAPMVMGLAMFAITANPFSLLFIAMAPLMMVGSYVDNSRQRTRQLEAESASFEEELSALAAALSAEGPVEREIRLAEAPSAAEVAADTLQSGPLLWTRRPEHWSFLNLRLGLGRAASRNTVVSGSGGGVPLPGYRARVDSLVQHYRHVDDVPFVENPHESGALGVAGPDAVVAGTVRGYLVQLAGLHSSTELVLAALVGPRRTPDFEWLKWLPHTSSPQSPIEGVHLADSAATGGALLAALEELVEARLAMGRADPRRGRERGPMAPAAAVMAAGRSVGAETDASPVAAHDPALVVLVSDDAPIERARAIRLAERGAEAGVYLLWIADEASALPGACRTFVDLAPGPEHARISFVRLSEVHEARTEQVSREVALAFGRRLASVIDAGAVEADSTDLPPTVNLLSLLGPEMASSPFAVVDRWRQNDSLHDRRTGATSQGATGPAAVGAGSGRLAGPHGQRRAGRLRALVGQAGAAAMHLDLRSQGPHALVGGTTGSGKSEFLQAWVLGMAAEYSPDRVTFLFVDYKGGSAFADCARLPHCVGLVTDLSPHLVRRALTSLRAELRHREHLLNLKKAKDLLELEKRGDPESPPALVIVIDEFAALATEVPEFVDGVVDIAQRGRSLGIHLIMATQRPAGVIKDNLRANTNLRIALRMADEHDSVDVIGDAVAARFDPALPGRAMAKTGPGRLTGFQSGYAGGWSGSAPERAEVQVAELRFGAETLWTPAGAAEPGAAVGAEPGAAADPGPTDPGPTDQARLVDSCLAAVEAAQVPAPRRPWLDELGPLYDLARLGQRSDARLVLGVADLPREQKQEAVAFEPDQHGHLAVYGTGGSGKTVLLRTLATAAGISPRGGPVDVYGLDFAGGGLRMLEALPHVGSVVPGDDSERVARLMRLLRDTMDERAERFSAVNAASITDYRLHTGESSLPRMLLLIDGFPSFREENETITGRSQWYSVFTRILAEGRQLGVHVALSADRPGSVPSSVSAAVQFRVVLRMADDSAYHLLDVPPDVIRRSSPAGRSIVDGFETQVAVFGGSESVLDQAAALTELAAAIERAGRAPAPAIRALPAEIAESSLPDAAGGLPVLGVADDDLAPLGFEPSGVLLVAGPPGSGRSNALQVLARSVARADPAAELHYLGNRRSTARRAVEWTTSAVSVDEVAASARELSARVQADPEPGAARIVVVIEAMGDFLQTPADAPLVELVKAVKRSDHLLLAESETSTWASVWPLLGEVKSARRGIILQPESQEGDSILRTSFPRGPRSEFPPGRGWAVLTGRPVRVQLPLADVPPEPLASPLGDGGALPLVTTPPRN
jgi:S-DNA-T family DNA segregation ATPase FtsK/SpoIIIE